MSKIHDYTYEEKQRALKEAQEIMNGKRVVDTRKKVYILKVNDTKIDLNNAMLDLASKVDSGLSVYKENETGVAEVDKILTEG